ncbi:MAG: DUF4347 domain-containing protein [Pirellulales bacterium]
MPLPSAASRWNPIQVRLGTYGMLQHLPLKKYLQSLSQQWSHWWNGSSSPDDAQQLDAIVLEDRILYSATPLMIAGDVGAEAFDQIDTIDDALAMALDESLATESFATTDASTSATITNSDDGTVSESLLVMEVTDDATLEEPVVSIAAEEVSPIEPTSMAPMDSNAVADGDDVESLFAASPVPSSVPPSTVAESTSASAEQLATDSSSLESSLNDTLDTASSLLADATSPSSDASTQNGLDNGEKHEIAFVNSNIEDLDALLASIDSDVEVVLLDDSRDGLEQITETLTGRSQLQSVHIFGHGVDGAFQVGGTWIDDLTLAWQSDLIASWQDSFADDADLLLYGCNVASTADGQAFVEALADLTGADVAASIDATGHASLGGNWALEYRTGSIETEFPMDYDAMSDWIDLLAITTNGSASSAQNTGVTSLSWSHTVASGSDRVMYVTLAIDGLGASVSSVTYGGVALTQVGRTTGNHAVEIWRLVSPTVGTGTIAVSLGATTDIKGGAVVYNGVDTSDPNGSYFSATGTSTTASVTVTSQTNDVVLDITNWDNNPSGYTIGAGQSSVWSLTNTAHRGIATTEAGAASVTMSSTVSASNQWEMGAISIRHAERHRDRIQ